MPRRRTHLLAVMFKDPQAAADKSLARQSVTLENLGWVRGHGRG